MGFFVWLLVGLVAGALARFLVPGRDPMSIVGTLILGLVGSLIGGAIFSLIFDSDGVGIVGSTIGAVIALLVYRAVNDRRRAV